MENMTLSETVGFLHSYEIECDPHMIEKWITEGKLKATKRDNSNTIIEMDVLDFIDELRWSGTAYEKEMDDQIKIGRMEKEISLLHKKVDKLKDEKIDFEFQLGISPFN